MSAGGRGSQVRTSGGQVIAGYVIQASICCVFVLVCAVFPAGTASAQSFGNNQLTGGRQLSH